MCLCVCFGLEIRRCFISTDLLLWTFETESVKLLKRKDKREKPFNRHRVSDMVLGVTFLGLVTILVVKIIVVVKFYLRIRWKIFLHLK